MTASWQETKKSPASRLAGDLAKGILSLKGNTSKTIINLRISNNLLGLNQNNDIDQSDIVYMYVSCTYIFKVRRSS